jgi:hypothetical protein
VTKTLFAGFLQARLRTDSATSDSPKNFVFAEPSETHRLAALPFRPWHHRVSPPRLLLQLLLIAEMARGNEVCWIITTTTGHPDDVIHHRRRLATVTAGVAITQEDAYS